MVRRIIGKLATLMILLTSVMVLGQSFGNTGNDKEVAAEDIAGLEPAAYTTAIDDIIDPDKYILGPGDRLGLNILATVNMTYPLTVTPTGDLFIPSVGTVSVGGLTMSEAVQVVQAFIHSHAYPSAKVNMALVDIRKFELLVTGAVNSPGYIVVHPRERLSMIIDRCDGFHQLAREYAIEIHRKNGQTLHINYLQFLRSGDLANNPTFMEGDKIMVPFGDIKTEGIVLRGAVEGSGYDIIEPNEMLGSFLRRRVSFNKNADLESIVITENKNEQNIFKKIDTQDLFTTELSGGMTIDIQWEKGVMVNGFVLAPGGFDFFPGYTAADYISMAGGNTQSGNPDRCKVRHLDGSVDSGQGVLIRRGDVIIVPRTLKDYFIGEMSMLQISVSLITIYLTFLATGSN